MCDSMFITDGDKRYFAKNSDRSPNEPNLAVFLPSRENNLPQVKCTYIRIKEVPKTYSCFVVKPSWTWGAEMGVNEKNVAIGNEAVFTKSKSETPSLIGMDFVRLGLERAASAGEAVRIIIQLLAEYGQGGNCGYDHNFYYDNSYLIVDPIEAYILETSGRDYAVRQLHSNANISNRLTIGTNYDYASGEFPLGFKHTNSDFLYTCGSKAALREKRVAKMSAELKVVDTPGVISILQNHRFEKGLFSHGDVGSVCMHKSLLGDHTTGSMIVNLASENPTIWITGASTPCLSIFKPYFLGQPDFFVNGSRQAVLSYWTKRELLNRAIFCGLVDKTNYLKDAVYLQKDFLTGIRDLRTANATPAAFEKFASDCDQKEQNFINNYNDVIEDIRLNRDKLCGKWKKLQPYLDRNPFGETVKQRLGLTE